MGTMHAAIQLFSRRRKAKTSEMQRATLWLGHNQHVGLVNAVTITFISEGTPFGIQMHSIEVIEDISTVAASKNGAVFVEIDVFWGTQSCVVLHTPLILPKPMKIT
jgi:hypothetical protein